MRYRLRHFFILTAVAGAIYSFVARQLRIDQQCDQMIAALAIAQITPISEGPITNSFWTRLVDPARKTDRVETIVACGKHISAQALDSISKMHNLRSADFSGSDLDDNGLERLNLLTHLETVDVTSTVVSAEEIERFMRRNQNVIVSKGVTKP